MSRVSGFKKKKIHETSGERSNAETNNLKAFITKMAYAKNESIYNDLLQELSSEFPTFLPYFMSQWDSLKEKWVQCFRKTRLNFGDATNNRVESFNQKIKAVVKKTQPTRHHAFGTPWFARGQESRILISRL